MHLSARQSSVPSRYLSLPQQAHSHGLGHTKESSTCLAKFCSLQKVLGRFFLIKSFLYLHLLSETGGFQDKFRYNRYSHVLVLQIRSLHKPIDLSSRVVTNFVNKSKKIVDKSKNFCRQIQKKIQQIQKILSLNPKTSLTNPK